MADISAELAAIESAVYGEEVRDAIRDGLEKMNSDLNTAIGTQVIDRATVDDILASEALSLKYSEYEELVTVQNLNLVAGDPGNFWIPYAKAQTLANMPVQRAGRLYVFPAKGSNSTDDGGIQVFISSQNSGIVEMWVRGWKGNTWQHWRRMSTIDETMALAGKGNNVLPLMYNSTKVYDRYGIHFEANDDGSIFINGTATGDAYYHLVQWDQNLEIEPGTYTLAGVPEGYENHIVLYATVRDGTEWLTYSGGYVTKEVSTKQVYRSYIIIRSGTTVSNLIARPTFTRSIEMTDGFSSLSNSETLMTKMEQTSLENRLPFPYPYPWYKTNVHNGVSYTINDDGSIVVNGTAVGGTSVLNFCVFDTNYKLEAGAYEVTCECDSDDVYFRVGYSQNDGVYAYGYTYPEKIVLSTDTAIEACVGVHKGATVNNALIKPQILKISDIERYKSPALSKDVLLERFTSAYVDNLLPLRYYSPYEYVRNGVTFVVNDDGSITANGTASADAYFNILHNTQNVKLSPGTYTLSGIDPVYSDIAYLYVATKGGTGWYVSSEGKTTRTIVAEDVYRAVFVVKAGKTANNLTVYPMFERGRYVHEYVPPMHSVTGLYSLVKDINVANIFPGIYYSGTRYVRHGVTFVVNEDGSITADGTATEDAYFHIVNRSQSYMLEAGPYTLSGFDQRYSDAAYLYVGTEGGTGWLLSNDASVTRTLAEKDIYRAMFVVKAGKTVSNLTVYPMFEKGVYAHDYKSPDYSTTDNGTNLVSIGGSDSAKIKYAISLIRSKWMPLKTIKYSPEEKNVYRTIDQGAEQNAIPYSSIFTHGGDVFFQRNLSTFYSAVKNPGSILYRDPFTYGSLRGPNYGGVCTSLTGWLCSQQLYVASTELPNKGFKIYDYNGPESIKIGDCLLTLEEGHIRLIYDIIVSKENYEVQYFDIIEQTTPWCKISRWPVKVLEDSLIENGGVYMLGRYPNCVIRDVEPVRYAEDVIPEMGDKTYYYESDKIYVYVPNGSVLYYKAESDTDYSSVNVSSLPTKTVNSAIMYDVSALLSNCDKYELTTDLSNHTKCNIMRVSTGSIQINDNQITVSGYSNWLTPVWYQVCSLSPMESEPSTSGYPAPTGYVASIVHRALIENDSFTIDIPAYGSGWYIRVNYETGFGQCFKDSNWVWF